MSLTPFANEPYVDFSQPGPAQEMRKALSAVRAQLGRHYPLRICGRQVATDGRIVSVNPGQPSEVVGEVGKATSELASMAVEAAAERFESWRRVDPDARARILLKAATILRRRIYEFSAWLVFEVSKSWAEAYADAAEAVDFLEFYGREMMRLGGSHPTTPFPGEETEMRYVPLGVGAVISPWNFPLAIMAGMTGASVVTGNTAVLKPASAAPVIAAKFLDVLLEAGLPEDVVQFVPGPGSQVGDVLADHPKTRFVAFTGSKEVGMRIHERAAKVHPGQIWIKRTILEMGGKDCVAVDAGFDPDAAAREAVISAFGFQGQKCSAGSRLIVHQDLYDAVLQAVIERTKNLTTGLTTRDDFYMGAVIDQAAFDKISGYIEVGKGEGRLVAQGPTAQGEGYFIPPTVFADVDPCARIAQEEIFGPVLAVIKARDFDHLLEIANGTEYGLTGALLSPVRAHLERARHEFHVGNLYFNRKCTGALVDVQPFGGFNMSGTDSKAGGRDYLQLFLQGKSVTERF
jgi:1-pyrroline-5-carboxylate dehydrogenase